MLRTFSLVLKTDITATFSKKTPVKLHTQDSQSYTVFTLSVSKFLKNAPVTAYHLTSPLPKAQAFTWHQRHSAAQQGPSTQDTPGPSGTTPTHVQM